MKNDCHITIDGDPYRSASICHEWELAYQEIIGGRRVHRLRHGRKCRQCRRLHALMDGDAMATGKLVCACGNPYVNISRLPQDVGRRIRSWKAGYPEPSNALRRKRVRIQHELAELAHLKNEEVRIAGK